MKPKEIHDLLLLLLMRGLGFWLLYTFFAANSIASMVEEIRILISPDKNTNFGFILTDFIRWITQFGSAVYLILGAPPFLKWATREKR